MARRPRATEDREGSGDDPRRRMERGHGRHLDRQGGIRRTTRHDLRVDRRARRHPSSGRRFGRHDPLLPRRSGPRSRRSARQRQERHDRVRRRPTPARRGVPRTRRLRRRDAFVVRALVRRDGAPLPRRVGAAPRRRPQVGAEESPSGCRRRLGARPSARAAAAQTVSWSGPRPLFAGRRLRLRHLREGDLRDRRLAPSRVGAVAHGELPVARHGSGRRTHREFQGDRPRLPPSEGTETRHRLPAVGAFAHGDLRILARQHPTGSRLALVQELWPLHGPLGRRIA